MLGALNLRETERTSGIGRAARRVVLLVVRVVEALGALLAEERLEVDVAARVAEGDDVVAVADAGRIGRPVAVLGVVQRVALRLAGDLASGSKMSSTRSPFSS